MIEQTTIKVNRIEKVTRVRRSTRRLRDEVLHPSAAGVRGQRLKLCTEPLEQTVGKPESIAKRRCSRMGREMVDDLLADAKKRSFGCRHRLRLRLVEETLEEPDDPLREPLAQIDLALR